MVWIDFSTKPVREGVTILVAIFNTLVGIMSGQWLYYHLFSFQIGKRYPHSEFQERKFYQEALQYDST